MLLGAVVAVALIACGARVYRWLDDLSPLRLRTQKIVVRNALYRLRLVPMLTRSERAYQLGQTHASGLRVELTSSYGKEIAELEHSILKLSATNDRLVDLLKLLTDARPHELEALKKRARRLLGEVSEDAALLHQG